LLLVLFAVCFHAEEPVSSIEERYLDFMVNYPKQYTVEEAARRYEIFKDNVRKIDEHNSKPGVSFQMGINEYADMTHEEFLKLKLSETQTFRDAEKYTHQQSFAHFSHASEAAPPTALDWRTNKNPVVVDVVKNTGACGSSIATVIVDSIGSDYAILSKEDVVSFDSHYVTDCDGQNCGGQTASVVWSFLTKYGLNWYYNGCPTGPGLGLCLTGNNCTKSGSEAELLNAVATKGPIPVQIDASKSSFQLYKSGVYYDATCSSSSLNHAVLIVGYGSTNGQDYWIARNSWGTSWGQNGDILLSRNKNNNCGVATAACYARGIKTCVCALEE